MNKDVYEYLLNFADDKTIINMLSVNRKFNDEKLFEKILKKKHPHLAFWKLANMTWKQFYIRQVYYMALLNEKYGIPFMSFKEFTPEFLFKNTKKKEDLLNHIVYSAAGSGDIDTVKLMIEKGANEFVSAFNHAAGLGHLNIVKFLLEKGYFFNPYQLGEALGFAARNGYIEIVKYLIDKGINYENWVLISAAKGGHLPIIDLAIQHGATAIESAILTAKDPETIEYLKAKL